MISEKADDGYSRVNFESPGFKEMMDEIRAGQVDCVIVKDACEKIGLNQKNLVNPRN